MADEIDDPFDDGVWHPVGPQREVAADPAPAPAARFISRLYTSASAPLRARMLSGLLRPLSPLGLVAVAAGAFAGLLQRGSVDNIMVAVDDVGRFTSEQVFELARFVEQVSPDALQQAAGLVADNPVNAAAFSVAVAMLLTRSLRDRGKKPLPTDQEPDEG
jgi:hypothetical protein